MSIFLLVFLTFVFAPIHSEGGSDLYGKGLMPKAPFWQSAEIQKKMTEEKHIAVSVTSSSQGKGSEWLAKGAGFVHVPLDFCWESLLNFRSLKDVPEYIEKVTYDPKKQKLHVNVSVFGRVGHLLLHLQILKGTRQIHWENQRGWFRGLRGVFYLRSMKHRVTEISMTAFYKSSTISIPRWVASVGAEMALHGIAKKVRQAIEKSWKEKRAGG